MAIRQAEKKIRNSWFASLFTGLTTLIATLVSMGSDTFKMSGLIVSGWPLLDVFLVFFMALGIYFKSRVAAISMFIYFLFAKVAQWAAVASGEDPITTASGILIQGLVGIVLLYLYFEGARGAIVYHRLRGRKETRDAARQPGGHLMSVSQLRMRAWLMIFVIGIVMACLALFSARIWAIGMSGPDSVITATILGGVGSAALVMLNRVGAPPLTAAPVDRLERLAQARNLRVAHSRRFGAILMTLGVGLWLASMILSAAMISNSGSAIILPALIVTSAGLMVRGRRMRARNAERALEGDPRPPIVYLRPFEIDHANRKAVPRDSFRGKTREQEMAQVLRDIAPFVALGDPTEDLPELGAVRFYADDAGWQEEVRDLTKRAGTIILYACRGQL